MDKKQIRHMMKERYYEASGRGNRDIRKILRRERAIGTIFTLTPVLVIAIFVFGAFGVALVLTFFNGTLDPTFSKIKYTGLRNWKLLFTVELPRFKGAIKNTLIFASITTACNIFGALIMSSLLNSKVVGKRKNLFMVLYFLPQITSSIASAIIFNKMVGKDSFIGLDLVKNPGDALYVIIISSVWGGISGGIVIFNSAFSGIDPSQYESASLDGASTWTKFKRITVPSLGPILSYTIITSIIGAMGVFDQAFVMSMIGADGTSVMTWALLGYGHIQGLQGTASVMANVGLGILELTLLGVTIFVATRIANIIRPMERK